MLETEAISSIENLNPATQESLGRVAFSTPSEIEHAVQTAHKTYHFWKELPPQRRARIFLRYQALITAHLEELARGIVDEQGKTFDDAKGDVMRGLEVVEYAASIPSLIMGETVENVASGMDTYSFQQPLGVCAGITPFNFPAMVPLWMFPLALACGNTFVLKPSEQCPRTPARLVELAYEAGLPEGALQLIQGGKEAVESLCDHPLIRAISFVGSTQVGRAVHERGTRQGKRVQALLGAKNHAVIMPDADRERSLNAVVGAAFGASGQRCMAVSVAVLVGEAAAWVDELVVKARGLKVGSGHGEVDLGPLISKQAVERVESLIQSAEEAGAELLLDGRSCVVPGYERGNFIGPTIVTAVDPSMAIYREELFGPVLCVLTVDTLDEALDLIQRNPYGNGASIFTESGGHARRFQHCVDAGQVGINVPIPVPLPFFSFTGWGDSIRGDLHAYGKHGVRFYTRTKTVTSRYFSEETFSNTLSTSMRNL
ncbi:MAG: CoA-acylating methylmalonate-semialdehyde dehydrogenase [Chlamydiia bacterium]|nr:CoA-acylating methylmalonate-semialdehyde dehydrogenase [Chlamydiia bacterium]